MDINKIMSSLEAKHPGESEYLQAVREVLLSIEDIYNQHPEFEKAKIIERLVEPDRIFTFRVTWVDDKGEVQTNLGYRVQFNNAIGPYKGGIRFHASVNLSILKFLGFEQTFKNALDDSADGRRKRWIRLLSTRQEQCGNHAFLPGIHAGTVASSGTGYGCAGR